jgi:inositol phosphorylceramide mannosyltransferase catalytic subunit
MNASAEHKHLASVGCASRPAIPKRIIQTAKSTDLRPLERAATATVKLHNPAFEYLFFDDAQVEHFIDTEFPEYRPLIEAFPARIQRYDFFRYLAIYKLGGFYFDTDVFLTTGLGALLKHSCVFAFEELSLNRALREQHGMDWEMANYAFGAAPGHPFLRAVIENCVRAQRDAAWTNAIMQPIPRVLRKEFRVLYTTGPGLVSRTFAQYQSPDMPVHVLFPDDVCDENNWNLFGSYGVHVHQGSWRQSGSLLSRKLLAAWRARERGIALKQARERGARRATPFEPTLVQA